MMTYFFEKVFLRYKGMQGPAPWTFPTYQAMVYRILLNGADRRAAPVAWLPNVPLEIRLPGYEDAIAVVQGELQLCDAYIRAVMNNGHRVHDDLLRWRDTWAYGNPGDPEGIYWDRQIWTELADILHLLDFCYECELTLDTMSVRGDRRPVPNKGHIFLHALLEPPLASESNAPDAAVGCLTYMIRTGLFGLG